MCRHRENLAPRTSLPKRRRRTTPKPARIKYVSEVEFLPERKKKRAKTTTDLSEGIEAVERPSGVALARVPPSLAGAKHRVGDLPVELAVVQSALRVVPDAQVDLLHIARGGTPEVNGAPA